MVEGKQGNRTIGGKMNVQKIKVADEVWIATGLLHRENPKREDFSDSEILAFWIFSVKETSRNPNFIGNFDLLYVHFTSNSSITLFTFYHKENTVQETKSCKQF